MKEESQKKNSSKTTTKSVEKTSNRKASGTKIDTKASESKKSNQNQRVSKKVSSKNEDASKNKRHRDVANRTKKSSVKKEENQKGNAFSFSIGRFLGKDKKNLAVQKYKKSKAKKDKKKRMIQGKFSLDILDLLIIVVLTAIVSCVLTGVILNFQFKKTSNLYDSNVVSDKNVQDFLNTYSEILENYYEEVDSDAMMKAAMEGMLSFLEDNYSIYLEQSDSDSLSEMLDGSYEGVGIVVSGTSIEYIYKDSPAEKAGFAVGDEIVEINGSAVSMENYQDINGLISLEEENTIVVLRDKKRKTFQVEAGMIHIPTTKTDIIEGTKKKNKIGYIYLSSFSSLSFEEFQESLMKMEKENAIDSLIIDLRGNSGGYLNVAYNIASLFLEKGKVVYSLESKNNITTYKDETSDKREYSVVVLVNSNTASAAEILTAALHDSYGAVVVGNTTYGKGKVQNMKYYEDSIVKYTSAKWLRPTGECIDEKGIVPDYEISISKEGDTIYDLQLDKAIAILSE